METILQLIKYSEYKWSICEDLKVIGLLLGMQMGYTKHQCFLCQWDSRDDSHHYNQKEWPARKEFVPGRFNVQLAPLVDPQKIYLPPLHIKLGLFKNFVKAMDSTGNGISYLRQKFPSKSEVKVKAVVFIGPEIRNLICDKKFDANLNSKEKAGWDQFCLIVKNFLGNYKSPNYVQMVTNFLQGYQELGAGMSLKIHFLHSYLDFSSSNMGDNSDEHGERFHKEIKDMEHRYQGKVIEHIMADYCWFLQNESDIEHTRKSNRQKFV